MKRFLEWKKEGIKNVEAIFHPEENTITIIELYQKLNKFTNLYPQPKIKVEHTNSSRISVHFNKLTFILTVSIPKKYLSAEYNNSSSQTFSNINESINFLEESIPEIQKWKILMKDIYSLEEKIHKFNTLYLKIEKILNNLKEELAKAKFNENLSRITIKKDERLFTNFIKELLSLKIKAELEKLKHTLAKVNYNSESKQVEILFGNQIQNITLPFPLKKEPSKEKLKAFFTRIIEKCSSTNLNKLSRDIINHLRQFNSGDEENLLEVYEYVIDIFKLLLIAEISKNFKEELNVSYQYPSRCNIGYDPDANRDNKEAILKIFNKEITGIPYDADLSFLIEKAITLITTISKIEQEAFQTIGKDNTKFHSINQQIINLLQSIEKELKQFKTR